jgi:hypothetical protein
VLGGTKVMPTLRALIDAASTPEDGAPGPT